MTSAEIKIEIDQGSSYDVTRTWSSGSPPVAVNLTGCTSRMQIRAAMTSPAPLLNLTTENGGIVLGGVAGTIRTVITATQTAALPPITAVYDLEIVYADGRVRRLFGGLAVISPEVTRSEGVV